MKRTANFKTVVMFVLGLLSAFHAVDSRGQDRFAPKRPVSRYDSASKTYLHIVNKAYVMYLDSTYRAKGYNDARHMGYVPAADTASAGRRPSPEPLITAQLKRDGLIPTTDPLGFTMEFKGEVMYINGRAQTPELSKKYLDIYKQFNREHPSPAMFRDPDEHLSRERASYMINRIELELINDKIVNDGDTLSVQLDDNYLIVNGVQQPVAVHQKYFDLFVKPMPGGKMRWIRK